MSCAIGCLITDEHYDKRIEGHGLNLEVIALVEKSLGVDIDSQCRYMLGELQTLHDSCDNEDWELDLDALQESLIEEGTF